MLGSSTSTGCRRRSSAASFSMYLRNSSSVVAPMHCNSPRASDGLRMFAASTAPSAAPAPTSMCISSMKRTQLPADFSSSITFFSRSSNSPRYFVPATRPPISSVTRRLPCSVSGTSPATMRWASPSTIAVLPTPGSPIRIGLFLVRRERIWIIRSISVSRPTIGSSFPWRAALVRSMPSASTVGVRVEERAPEPVLCGTLWERMRVVSARTRSRFTPRLSSTLAAMPSPSRTRPSSRCSVPM